MWEIIYYVSKARRSFYLICIGLIVHSSLIMIILHQLELNFILCNNQCSG